MNDIKVRIIKNLKERAHAVNSPTTLHGLESTTGCTALAELISNGTVEIELLNVAMPGKTPIQMELYKLCHHARMQATEGLRSVK